jgi:hypothetical protein
MPPHTFASTGRLLAAGVVATAGLLAIPAGPVQAANCVWEFNGPFTFTQGDGFTVDLPTDQSKSVTAGIAVLYDPVANITWNGAGSGGIQGNSISVNVEWFGLENRSYPGTIGPDGLVAGTVQGPTVNTTYQSTSALRCIPEDAAAQRGVTVNGDVDLYDVPDGVGNIIGMLRQGTTVQLVEPCREGWCHVQNGWVWGEFLDQ